MTTGGGVETEKRSVKIKDFNPVEVQEYMEGWEFEGKPDLDIAYKNYIIVLICKE